MLKHFEYELLLRRLLIVCYWKKLYGGHFTNVGGRDCAHCMIERGWYMSGALEWAGNWRI